MNGLVAFVIGLTFAVDLLLVLGTNRLAGAPPGGVRAILSGLISAAYTGFCLHPALIILRGGIFRIMLLSVMVMVAFGFSKSAARRGLLFLLLKFALQGAAGMIGKGGLLSAVLTATGLACLAVIGIRGPVGEELIPVELHYKNKLWRLTALRDTGNTLMDPLTGERVWVADAGMGEKLLGLSASQLSAPTETLASGLAPGMRLIPYRTVGQQGAMMLATRIKDVKAGSWKGSALVAFAPERFGNGEGYQMLIGGMVG